jgi:cytochrome c
VNGEVQRLIELARSLAPEQRHALLEFAEFLVARSGTVAAAEPVAEPQHEPRPDNETVVRAIQRLTRTYPMLDRRKLLVETSRCVESHVLQGRAATEVIEELEIVFARHYEAYRDR